MIVRAVTQLGLGPTRTTSTLPARRSGTRSMTVRARAGPRDATTAIVVRLRCGGAWYVELFPGAAVVPGVVAPFAPARAVAVDFGAPFTVGCG